jgi:hypothetical protein
MARGGKRPGAGPQNGECLSTFEHGRGCRIPQGNNAAEFVHPIAHEGPWSAGGEPMGTSPSSYPGCQPDCAADGHA